MTDLQLAPPTRLPWISTGMAALVAVGGVLFGLGVFHPAPATFTMTGSIQINGSPGEDFLADDTGTCSGTGGYSDMNAGTAVTSPTERATSSPPAAWAAARRTATRRPC